jgi:NADPH-dependent 2,4-dienoyl-CoA reductase/sulfur reductase-like enzyme
MAKKRVGRGTRPQGEDTETLSRREFFKSGTAAGVSATVLAGGGTALAQTSAVNSIKWDYEADVVVLGAGATGFVAAIRAKDLGASVLVIDQNFDAGGKMTHSGGWVSLGGGDAIQDREVQRAHADNAVATRQLMLDNYVRFARIEGTHQGGGMTRARGARAILKLADATDKKAGTVSRKDAGSAEEERNSLFNY